MENQFVITNKLVIWRQIMQYLSPATKLPICCKATLCLRLTKTEITKKMKIFSNRIATTINYLILKKNVYGHRMYVSRGTPPQKIYIDNGVYHKFYFGEHIIIPLNISEVVSIEITRYQEYDSSRKIWTEKYVDITYDFALDTVNSIPEQFSDLSSHFPRTVPKCDCECDCECKKIFLLKEGLSYNPYVKQEFPTLLSVNYAQIDNAVILTGPMICYI
jgi:hypothetical protein